MPKYRVELRARAVLPREVVEFSRVVVLRRQPFVGLTLPLGEGPYHEAARWLLARVVLRRAGYLCWVEDDFAADEEAAEGLMSFYEAAGWVCVLRGTRELFDDVA